MGKRFSGKSVEADNLFNKIQTRTARCGIIGLGYVGLPLAVEFAKTGFTVTGFDLSGDKIKQINKGKSYIADISSRDFKILVSSGKLSAVDDFSRLSQMDVINICVPTPLSKTKSPDVSHILEATQMISQNLRKGQLIILESTTYPGTTDELVQPILESTGLKIGKDIFLAFSPERIDPGNPKYNTKNIPKVVGGITPDCTRLAVAFYQTSLQTVIPVSSSRVAETVKLLENTFRSINIGLVNEFAQMCDKLGIDVWEVIEAAATKPFGFMPFYPGPGLGGHCIPVDPFYLSWRARSVGFEARFIELAGHINASMPEYVVSKVVDGLNHLEKSVKKSKILVLGVSYKANVNDIRESPALDIIDLLEAKGAIIHYSDPYVPEFELNEKTYRSQDLNRLTLAKADCVIIATAHAKFDYKLIFREAKVIVDTRNAMKSFKSPKIIKL